jgi:hypothetical protein
VLIGSTPIGGPILGWLCDAAGARAGVVLGGVAAIAAATWGLLAARRVGLREAAVTDAARSVPEAVELTGTDEASSGVVDPPAA